jgi:hypothetical protein
LPDKAVRFEGFRRKVLHIPGYDSVGMCFDGCREHMPIVWIWQGNGVDMILKPSDKRIGERSIHERFGPLQLNFLEIRPILE